MCQYSEAAAKFAFSHAWLVAVLCGGSIASTALGQTTLFVNQNAPPGGSGQSWSTAFDDLQDALDTAAGSGGTIREIWVAAGVYTPDGGTGDREGPRRALALAAGLRRRVADGRNE